MVHSFLDVRFFDAARISKFFYCRVLRLPLLGPWAYEDFLVVADFEDASTDFWNSFEAYFF